MKKLFIYLFCCFHLSAVGQMSQHSEGISSITKVYTPVQIAAYQDNATGKISDYYQYLSLLSSDNTEPALKDEVERAILLTFKDSTTLVTDLLSGQNNLIPLSEFIKKVRMGKNISFSVKNIRESAPANENSWEVAYEVSVISEGILSRQQVLQKIFFQPESKAFGTSNKVVWSTYLWDFEKPLIKNKKSDN